MSPAVEAAAGCLALAALLLLPGLVIVRSPWVFVPFLSASFWLVTWGWLPPDGPGRERFLKLALVGFALLASLRLPKPLGATRPALPTLLVLGFALLRLLPFGAWPAAPGLDAGFASSAALLLCWRDGIPASYLPLQPVLGFDAGAFGVSALAADVALLAGLEAHRALLLAQLASEGLLVLAAYALAVRFMAAGPAATVAVAAAAAALLALAPWEAEGAAALALALGVAGAGLVLRGRGRASAVAAGLLFGAALAALGAPGALAAGLPVVVAGLRSRAWPDPRRLGLAAGVAAVLAAPTLLRTAAPGLPGARAVGSVLVLAGGLALAGAAVGLARRPASRSTLPAGFLALALTLGEFAARGSRVVVTDDSLKVAAWLRTHTRPPERVCAAHAVDRAWVPAIAGRATQPSRLPGGTLRPFGGGGACVVHLERGGPSDGSAAFRASDLSIVTPP
jgi:hypothetical protein